ncbi:MAG: flagellar hook capping protein [Acidobacteriota bacterium]|nr:flagellar hook capping protein [Acidobacteriota bacterium]
MSPTSSTASTTTSGTTATPSASKDPLGNESTFLTLLVSQLKNQDPLSPVDSTAFVSQLTSYSQLEQLIAINKNTTASSSTTGS